MHASLSDRTPGTTMGRGILWRWKRVLSRFLRLGCLGVRGGFVLDYRACNDEFEGRGLGERWGFR